MKLSVIDPSLDDANKMLAASPISTNQKTMKVLLYGNIQGAQHRSQTLIKFLLDSRYPISLVSPNFYLKRTYFWLKKVLVGVHLIEFFIKAVFADIIFVLPLNNNLIDNALLAKRLFRSKLILENHVSLYVTLIEENENYKEGNKKAKLEMRRDRLSLTKPDYVITTCEHETVSWAEKLGINYDKNKVFIAPIFSGSKLTLKRKFLQDSILRICWWGSFIPLHGLDNILQAMKLLKEKKVPFTCNLFGIDNPSFSVYAEKIQLQQLDTHVYLRKNLTFFDESLPQYLVENCDLALGIFGNTSKAHNGVPTKLVEALSMGIPTLTMNSPALKDFFDPQTDLWTCEPSPVSIAETIIKIIGGIAYPVDWDQTRQKVLSTFSNTQYQMVVSNILGKIADNTY